MSSDIGITVNREQQPGKIPAYPFLTYNITSDNQIKHYQRSVTYDNITDTTIDKHLRSQTKSTVSITLHDKNDLSSISELCASAFDWFGSDDGIEYCRQQGYRVNPLNQSQNRSVFIEDYYWENKLGFDVEFATSNERKTTIPRVQEIIIKPTINGESQPDITI